MTFNAGFFMANAFPVGYYPENYFTEYGLAAAPQSASRLRQIITKLETVPRTSYWDADAWEPGEWNEFSRLREIIRKMEQL